jgi:hypothetical protein
MHRGATWQPSSGNDPTNSTTAAAMTMKVRVKPGRGNLTQDTPCATSCWTPSLEHISILSAGKTGSIQAQDA